MQGKDQEEGERVKGKRTQRRLDEDRADAQAKAKEEAEKIKFSIGRKS